MNQYLKYFSLVSIIVLGSFFSPISNADPVNNTDPVNNRVPANKNVDTLHHQAYMGLWQTIDDETNQPRSLVLISINKGQLSAKITKVYPAAGESDEPLCDKCKGKLKNVKIIGLNILREMAYEDNAWQGGEILDPNNGKFYDAKIWLEKGQLQVRGYIGFFFRTQQWRKFKTK